MSLYNPPPSAKTTSSLVPHLPRISTPRPHHRPQPNNNAFLPSLFPLHSPPSHPSPRVDDAPTNSTYASFCAFTNSENRARTARGEQFFCTTAAREHAWEKLVQLSAGAERSWAVHREDGDEDSMAYGDGHVDMNTEAEGAIDEARNDAEMMMICLDGPYLGYHGHGRDEAVDKRKRERHERKDSKVEMSDFSHWFLDDDRHA
ncbi:hypothetical protein ACEQ8H_004147 [Pleosporales sp. CAS-2024a]